MLGCTSDEVQDYNPELRLMFQPDMYMQVAHDSVECFPANETFAVQGWKLSQAQTWKNDAENATVFLPVSEAKRKGALWAVDDNLLWPDYDESLTFIAYAPYRATCRLDVENGVSYTTDILQDQTDVLYTDPHADRRKLEDGWVVPMYFKHTLCRVDFRIKHRVDVDEKITVKRIVLDKVRHRGTFRSLASPQWETEEDDTSLTFFEGSREIQALPDTIGRYWMMIPQPLDTSVTVEYEFTDPYRTLQKRVQTVPVRTLLESGRTYTYTLSVGMNDVRFLQEILE